jgi:choline dehydrogenase
VTIGAVALQPHLRGRIELASPDPAAKPAINAGYLSDPGAHDLAVLLRGIRLARRILATAPLASEIADEYPVSSLRW